MALSSRPCATQHPGPWQDYPHCPACKLRGEASAQARRFRQLWGETEPVPAQLAPTTLQRKLPCIHLGDPTGEMVACPTCRGHVELKAFACAKYGKCLPTKPAPGVVCCLQCGDYTPRLARQVVCGSRGIGDMGMMLLACAGLKRDYPADEVLFVLPQGCYLPLEPWAALFGGYDRLLAAEVADVQTYHPYNTYAKELDERAKTRSAYYAEACGTTPALPEVLPARPEDASWAEPYRGVVVLSPWSAWPGRMWDHNHWLALERDLLSKGRRVVVIDNESNRCAHFSGEKIVGQSAGRIAALLRVCACLVANQSGMAVIGGLLRVKTLVLNGAIHGRHLWADFPSVRWLDGKLPCGDCHWRGLDYARKQKRCDVQCESLSTISPGEVASTIADLLYWRRRLASGPSAGSRGSEITITTCQGIGDTVWALQCLLPHYSCVNVNIAVCDEPVNQHATRAAEWLALLPGVGEITAELVTHQRYQDIATGRPAFPAAGGAVDFAVNAYLESGMRLEAIYPERAIIEAPEWPDEYTPKAPRQPFLLCYVSAATLFPHAVNQLGIWTPADWADFLGPLLSFLGLRKLLFIGADYDADAAAAVARLLPDVDSMQLIGLPPKQVIYLLKKAAFFVGYQSGLNVVADQVGCRQLMLYFPYLWRMLYAWCRPSSLPRRFRADVFRHPLQVLDALAQGAETLNQRVELHGQPQSEYATALVDVKGRRRVPLT